jgi:PKD repeat protein
MKTIMTICFYTSLLFLCFSCKLKEPLDYCLDNFIPAFDYTVDGSEVPIKVTVINKTQNASYSTTYKWSFDSLYTSIAKDTSFTYTKQGVHKIKLTVTNCSGKSYSVDTTITLNSAKYVKPLNFPTKNIGTKIFKTANNEFIVCGITLDSSAMWVGRLDKKGTILWQQKYDELGKGEARDVIEARDGSIVVCGSVYKGIERNIDIVVAKLNASGEKMQIYEFGGKGVDAATSIKQTIDDGFIIAGYSNSNDWKVRPSTMPLGDYDMLLLKISTNGVAEWDSRLGSPNYDGALSVVQLSDQSYIVCGSSAVKGHNDAFIVKTNIVGQKVKELLLGGIGEEVANTIKPTRDSQFIISGYTTSLAEGSNGGRDVYIIKIKNDLTVSWKKPYGNTTNEESYDIVETRDGGFAAIGYRDNISGTPEVYLLKTDAKGDEIFNKKLGDITKGRGSSLIETPDCGFMIFGTVFNLPLKDFLVIKTDEKANFK